MSEVIFTQSSGVAESIYGKSQAPIRMFIEKQAEAFEQQSLLPYLFAMATSKNYAEKLTAMTAMDGFVPVGENGEYPSTTTVESFSKTLEHMTWKNKFAISREMVDDAKLMDLKKKPAAFIASWYRTREMFGAALYAAAAMGQSKLTFGDREFDVTSADGKALFAIDHPSKVGKKTQCNLFSDAFSNKALGAAESAMQDFRGDNGEVQTVAPTTIMIANDYELKMDVFAAIGADKDPETANNGFNYNFGRWNVIINPYLNQFLTEGVKPWILLDKVYNEENSGAAWFDRVNLEVFSHIAENDANEWKGYGRFSAGFNNWRFAACGGIEGGKALVG